LSSTDNVVLVIEILIWVSISAVPNKLLLLNRLRVGYVRRILEIPPLFVSSFNGVSYSDQASSSAWYASLDV
jgi:hypothetical protein